MQTLKPTEVAQVSEKLVEEWLSENGFINVVNNMGVGGIEAILANGSIENIFVHVRSNIHPAGPVKVSDEDRNAIKATAEGLGRMAYVAYVVIDEGKNVVGEISWQRLS